MTTQSNPRAGAPAGVQAILDVMRTANAARVLEPEAMRSTREAMIAMLNLDPPQVAVERAISMPGAAGDIPAKLIVPRDHDARLPVVLYLHGGGFVVMSPASHAKLTKRIALAVDAIVISVDYRLSPETPHPGALDDCVAAFRWAREHAAELGGDPARIAIGGDSAGGNLAAATSLRLLAEGDAPPEAVLLLCAWLDLPMETPSFDSLGPDDAVIDDEVMEFFRRSYAPDAEIWRDPLVSPLRADLSAFPPTCVVVGTLDPLYDDGVRFAEKLRAAGRDVALQSHEWMPHDFPLWPGTDAPEPIEAMCGFLRQRLAATA
jgi:acetyl esterase